MTKAEMMEHLAQVEAQRQGARVKPAPFNYTLNGKDVTKQYHDKDTPWENMNEKVKHLMQAGVTKLPDNLLYKKTIKELYTLPEYLTKLVSTITTQSKQGYKPSESYIQKMIEKGIEDYESSAPTKRVRNFCKVKD